MEDIVKELILKEDKTANEETVLNGFNDYTIKGNPLAEKMIFHMI